MRRFGWQIGGVGVALVAVVALAALAFGACGSSSRVSRSAVSPTARATASADPRVAEVEAAARRYVEALEASAKSGDASAVDALVMPGSQAEGNAGIVSSFSRANGYNFIASRIEYASDSWQVTVVDDTATVLVTYSVFGHAADWPSLRPRESDHEAKPTSLHLEFELSKGQWLVSRSS
jgi:hypothetical protein